MPKLRLLRITLHEGKELSAKDVNGKSDPYVIIKLQGSEKESKERTTVCKKTLNPEWEEKFEFKIKQSCNAVAFELKDKDHLKKDDKMGVVVLEFDALQEGKPFSGWLAVSEGDGEIRLTVEIEDTNEDYEEKEEKEEQEQEEQETPSDE